MKRSGPPAHNLVLSTWGKSIKRERTRQGLSQVDLAERLTTDQGTVSRIERGKYPRMTPEMILRVAVALGCAPDEICPWPVGIADLARYDQAAA